MNIAICEGDIMRRSTRRECRRQTNSDAVLIGRSENTLTFHSFTTLASEFRITSKLFVFIISIISSDTYKTRFIYSHSTFL
jgi:hypothetical protein